MQRYQERELLCELNDEEMLSRGQMQARTITEIDAVEEERSNGMKVYKKRLEGLHESNRKLAGIIRTRQETRIVRCVVLFHAPTTGRKQIVRTDTGEIIAEEEMSDAEKQMKLFHDGCEVQAEPDDQAAEQEGAVQ